MTALLVLEDGSVFWGVGVGAEGLAVGEVVFNTAMTGYQEILTDPSYARQIVTLTYPHIGNTGVNAEDEESDRVHASGLVIRDYPIVVSNFRSQGCLNSYLRDRGVVGITTVDTRRLTRLLRERGAQAGCIMSGEVDEQRAAAAAKSFPGLQGMDVAQHVTTGTAYRWRQGSWRLGAGLPGERSAEDLPYRVVAYDFGVKRNILRMLVDKGCDVWVVPATTPASEVLALRPDGVFLSNGPGDPEPCGYAIAAIREIVAASLPVFGICLGHQLLALACGARTVKMKFGHHGANHPVSDVDRDRVMITSQNHGFAVDAENLPAGLRVTHTSLFDGSLQGIHLTDRPAFGFQGHPEASPGPHDCAALFDHFIELIEQRRSLTVGGRDA